MSAQELSEQSDSPVVCPTCGAPVGNVWNIDKLGREYLGRIIYRREGETVAQALKRSKDRPPEDYRA